MAGPGQPKTGGREKGTQNKATAAVKEAIVAAFNEVGGKNYLIGVASRTPSSFALSWESSYLPRCERSSKAASYRSSRSAISQA